MIHFKHKGEGAEFGIEYRFTNPGDSLPPHSHTKLDAHSVHCVTGRVGVSVAWRDSFGQSRGVVRVLLPGETYVIDWWQEHWITALDPESVIFNRFLNGKPESYNTLPAAGIFTYGGNNAACDTDRG